MPTAPNARNAPGAPHPHSPFYESPLLARDPRRGNFPIGSTDDRPAAAPHRLHPSSDCGTARSASPPEPSRARLRNRLLGSGTRPLPLAPPFDALLARRALEFAAVKDPLALAAAVHAMELALALLLAAEDASGATG